MPLWSDNECIFGIFRNPVHCELDGHTSLNNSSLENILFVRSIDQYVLLTSARIFGKDTESMNLEEKVNMYECDGWTQKIWFYSSKVRKVLKLLIHEKKKNTKYT